MEIKFTFLSVEEPYSGKSATYYSFGALMGDATAMTYVSVETTQEGYEQLKALTPSSIVTGVFQVKPSFNRKRPELHLVRLKGK